jgi:hypothetical protein
MLTHGSDCQRAGSGPFVALVAVSKFVEHGIGTLPMLTNQPCYSTEAEAPRMKKAGDACGNAKTQGSTLPVRLPPWNAG